MKVIILAGGFGTRLSEYTDVLPKPMIPVGGKPIVWHIMRTFARFGHKDFLLALGYKADVVKEYFLNYLAFTSDFTIDLATGVTVPVERAPVDWRVTLVDTGLTSMTGGRVKRLRHLVGNETCLLTYGDGVADVDLDALVAFHRQRGKLVTVTAVRPPARFGELELDGDLVANFREKPQLGAGWINGGYFVVEPAFFDLIEGDSTMLEREPLEAAANMGQFAAYRHSGFWHCMDTKRDHELLETMWSSGGAPWARGLDSAP